MHPMRFGKQSFRFDSRTLHFAHYASTTYTPPPYAENTWGITDWGMMINGPDPEEPAYPDGLGDCTIASCGHAVQVWTKGKITPPDSLILTSYEKWCGYVPGNPNTDNGSTELNVLNRWRNSTFGGHVLVGYADPQPGNFGHVMHSIAEFGGVYIGLQLPNSAVTQNQNGQIWDVVRRDGGIAGGHAVYCPAYHIKDTTANGKTTITCITWGKLQKMTLAFWEKYCDESHTLLGAAWQPAGFNTAQLKADLPSVAG
jgi:hypothetical protein